MNALDHQVHADAQHQAACDAGSDAEHDNFAARDHAGSRTTSRRGLTSLDPGAYTPAHCRERGHAFGARSRLRHEDVGLPVQQAA